MAPWFEEDAEKLLDGERQGGYHRNVVGAGVPAGTSGTDMEERLPDSVEVIDHNETDLALDDAYQGYLEFLNTCERHDWKFLAQIHRSEDGGVPYLVGAITPDGEVRVAEEFQDHKEADFPISPLKQLNVYNSDLAAEFMGEHPDINQDIFEVWAAHAKYMVEHYGKVEDPRLSGQVVAPGIIESWEDKYESWERPVI